MPSVPIVPGVPIILRAAAQQAREEGQETSTPMRHGPYSARDARLPGAERLRVHQDYNAVDDFAFGPLPMISGYVSSGGNDSIWGGRLMSVFGL